MQAVRVNTLNGPAISPHSFTYYATIEDEVFMQNITAATCSPTKKAVVDARDNKTYWVQRIGNLCWMHTNLAYAGGGNNSFGDTMTLTQGVVGVNTGVGQVCFGEGDAMNTFGQGCFWIPDGANPTTFPARPLISTTGFGQYGYLYSWCAAMGNQPVACQTTAATQPNQSVNDGTNDVL
jgi:hypothetical protein